MSRHKARNAIVIPFIGCASRGYVFYYWKSCDKPKESLQKLDSQIASDLKPESKTYYLYILPY